MSAKHVKRSTIVEIMLASEGVHLLSKAGFLIAPGLEKADQVSKNASGLTGVKSNGEATTLF